MASLERYSPCESGSNPATTPSCYESTTPVPIQEEVDPAPYYRSPGGLERVTGQTLPFCSQEPQPEGHRPTFYGSTTPAVQPELLGSPTSPFYRQWYSSIPTIQSSPSQGFLPYIAPYQLSPATCHFNNPGESCPVPCMMRNSHIPTYQSSSLQRQELYDWTTYSGYPISSQPFQRSFEKQDHFFRSTEAAPLHNSTMISLPSIGINSFHTDEALMRGEERGASGSGMFPNESIDILNMALPKHGNTQDCTTPEHARINITPCAQPLQQCQEEQTVGNAYNTIQFPELHERHIQEQTTSKLNPRFSKNSYCTIIKTAKGDVYQCKTCQNLFATTLSYNRHCRKCPPSKRIYICKICSMVFHWNKVLMVHKRVHTGEKPYKCRYCGDRFSDNSSKKKHERIHTKEKPYQCADCNLKFSQSGNLHRHIRSQHKLVVNKGLIKQREASSWQIYICPNTS